MDDDESPDFETFMDDLEDGIALKILKKWLGKSAAQERKYQKLDQNRNVLYWQKGRKQGELSWSLQFG